ncbi:TolC family protein [Pontixanthobacter rizhaonensis]
MLCTGPIVMLLAGCVSMAPAEQTPNIVSDIPDTFPSEVDGKPYKPAAWWNAFEDPVLDGLVTDALKNNLDIAEAAARLEQVTAQARITRASLLPSVSAGISASQSSSPLAGSAFGDLGAGAINRIENETYSPSLSAAYELDLFGRARNDYAAARQDAVASAYDLQSVQLSAAAQAISAYFDIVDTRRQIELTVLISDVLNDRAERTDEQFRRGLSDSFELFQIRQELRSAQASLPQFESALADTENRLAVLIGTYPQPLRQRLSQSLTPRLVFEPVPAGLPIDLLSQRPDVAANWARLDAARLRIGARKAERFPQISLSGSVGTQGDTVSAALDFADNWTTSLAANIVAPIFNAGRISANIRSARALYDQQAAIYARTVLTAYQESSSAIEDYEEQRQRYLLITAQLDDAELSLDLQKRRFSAGVGSYVSYLDALTTVYRVQSDLSSSARATALARLSVHQALAGNWAPDIEPEKPPMTTQVEQSPPAASDVQEDQQ